MDKEIAVKSVLDNVSIVVFQTMIGTALRDTGEGKKDKARVEKILQTCFDPAILRLLGVLKTRSLRLLRDYGTKLDSISAYAVPNTRIAMLLEELGQIRKDWDEATMSIAAKLSDNVRNWAGLYPADRATIFRLAPSPEEFVKGTRYNVTAFALAESDVLESGALREDFDKMTLQTVTEISRMVRDASLHDTSGSLYKTQATLNVLERIERKARAMSFIDPLLEHIANELEIFRRRLPLTDHTSGIEALGVKALFDRLYNPKQVMRKGLFNVKFDGDVGHKAVPEPKRKSAPKRSAPTNDAGPAAPTQSTNVVALGGSGTALRPGMGSGGGMTVVKPGAKTDADDPQAA
jgi:hypothetical protein